MSKYAPKPAGGCWGGGGVKTGAVEVNLQLFDVKGLNLFQALQKFNCDLWFNFSFFYTLNKRENSPFNCKGKYYPLLLAM